MLKVAIVGCGRIADQHVQQIQRIKGCEIVAACDLEPLMAEQLCERFKIREAFSSITELLKVHRPHVTHITTPPQSHLSIAKECLEAGSHVYVEKPFTLNANDSQVLIDYANARQLKLTVGHDLQFAHVSRRMRQLVAQGYLGGPPNHMESYYCYEHADAASAKASLGDGNHWVRRLPGQLLHNIISHGIARIAEFLPGESLQVKVIGFVSPFLKSVGEHEIIDELRVAISDAERTTAYFTFSSQMRPSLNLFRLYGARNGLELDPEREILIKLRGDRFKSYAERFIPPLNLAAQHVRNVATNFRAFLANDFHVKSGMKHLIESFYQSITAGTPLPIPYREIVLTARIMDDIFDQLKDRNAGDHVRGGHAQGDDSVPLDRFSHLQKLAH